MASSSEEIKDKGNCLQSKVLKEIILNGTLNRPVVIRQKIDQWPCRKWTLDDWAKKFGKKKIGFRMGPIHRSDKGPLWESACHYTEATIGEFVEWQRTDKKDAHSMKSTLDNTSLSGTDRSKHWAYADYKHMLKIFDINDDDHMFHCVDWSVFGFDGRNGKESTIWIGSPASETPCHYDTYGCNLVAQLIGRKRWILFPPHNAENVYPTRIPYEESSVFSQVNVRNPDVIKHNKFKAGTPYVVTLEPGEVLFVPHKWWHYVTSLTTTVSINSWIELETDNESRLEEAVTRALVSAFAETYSFPNTDWLNPTEQDILPEENLGYIRESLDRCLKEKSSDETGAYEERIDKTMSGDRYSPPEAKRARVGVANFDLNEFGDEIKSIVPSTYSELMGHLMIKENDDSATDEKDEEAPFQTVLINTIVDPEVVSLICHKLKTKFNHKV